MVTDAGSGLIGSIKRLLSTLTQLASVRLELLANELQEERLHLEQRLVYFFAALVCFGMTMLLLTVFIVVLFWDSHRLLAMGGLSAVFFATGLILLMRLQQMAQQKSRLFADSLAEFAKDGDQLNE